MTVLHYSSSVVIRYHGYKILEIVGIKATVDG